MFGLFKKTTKLEKLQKRYEKLLEEAFHLSKVNRTQSDAKTAEANLLLEEIEAIQSAK